MSTVARFGTWESSLQADVIAQKSLRLGAPTYAGGLLHFIEARPSEGGRQVLVRREANGELVDVVPAPFNVRTRVHEYGGRAYVVDGDDVWFVHDDDQALHHVARGTTPKRLTAAGSGWRFAEPLVDRRRERVVAVAEHHDGKERFPRNALVSVSGTGEITEIVSGADFYAAPALSPDGRCLAYLSWNHPRMPWDAATVWCARLDDRGNVVDAAPIAGGEGGAAFQPTWSAEGVLYFSLEVDDAWALHRWKGTGTTIERVGQLPGELGTPLWQLGTRLFGFISAHELACAPLVRGQSQLHRLDVASGDGKLVRDDFVFIGDVACTEGKVAVLLGWSGSGSELRELDTKSGEWQVVRDVFAGLLPAADVSTHEAIEFPTAGGERAHGYFYAPKNAAFVAPEGTKPPLVVIVHGGPTGGTAATFNPRVQFWTHRGFAVLDVNYRGSTGYGRAYRERLRREWGVIDVEDCVAGASFLAEQGRVDGKRMIIRGGSAGGYTVLQALAHHDVFRAGGCHYGVSDLEALIRDTHKFESRYDEFLIGSFTDERPRFVERSPLHHVDRIVAPIAFFQGLEDKAVPPNQTEAMADALKARGIDAEYHPYPGEQHGFRKAENIRHSHDAELAFYRRVLAL